jgi:exodeoxyribonuclease V beta subunit
MVLNLKAFNVLDRHLDIHRNYLIQASAGTGKTFSIENIVVRLLLEKETLSLEKILVVTFTRAAVRDLKIRIRTNIEKALNFLLEGSFRKLSKGSDYLLKVCEEGEASIAIARRRLEQALLIFDQSQIFTIHSFCARVLSENVFESNMKADSVISEEPFSQKMLLGIVKDFFRTEVRPEVYSSAQLKLILKEHNYSTETLEIVLLELITRNIEIEESPPYSLMFEEFKHIMQILKQDLNSHQFIQDFIVFAPSYKGFCDREGKIKLIAIESIKHFFSLFDKDTWERDDLEWLITDQLFHIKAISLENLKKGKVSDKIVQFTKFCQRLDKNLAPFISGAKVLSRMASDCQKLFRARIAHEESMGFDDILHAMRGALENPQFIKQIRSRYKAALIDEFQDTDPLQWEIFQKLFLDREHKGYLYLVGDPKQSIYSFRQADIYTYLNAAETLGSQHHASLDTNYRSNSKLVHALNVLFTEASSRGWLELPRLGRKLNYDKVKSIPSNVDKKLVEERGAIHFLLAEDKQGSFSFENLEQEKFFPYIAREIQRLHMQCDMPLSQCAVLVADRYQAERLAVFFKKWKIPFFKQRAKSLITSKALPALRELLKGIVDCPKGSSLKIALGGKIIQWTYQQICSLELIDELEKIVGQFYKLKKKLETKSFACFYEFLLDSSWHTDGYSVKERLLGQNDGIEFLNELQEIVNLLLEHECNQGFSLEGLIDYLDHFQTLYSENNPIVSPPSEETEAVNILTLHASKGLEFSVVFPIGLIKRTQNYSSMMPVFKEGKLRLSPIINKDEEEYKHYCREIDAEKLRLLYVAMTRAKHHIYCPIVFGLSSKETAETASPMELFLTKLGLSSDIKTIKNYFDQLSCDLDYIILEGAEQKLDSWRKKVDVVLEAPPNLTISKDKKYIRSFTSLCSELEKIPLSNLANETFPDDSRIKTSHTLPTGSETGNFLHHLLETISFSEAKKSSSPKDFFSFVHYKTCNTGFEGWEEVFCEILYNAMKTPIFEKQCLANINSDKIFRETEFFYPTKLFSGYLKGFVDLFFEDQGKYYLVDWKSNWLGDDLCSYHIQNMEKVMKENHYLLQANIYKEALKKYLHLVEKRPFSEVFGGTFYVFLRGFCIKEECKYGVYKIL